MNDDDRDEQDDTELLGRWQDGDPKAGTALYRRHFKRLYRFIHGKAPEAADDLIQSTFIKLQKAKFRGDANTTFRSFITQIAWRTILQHYRKNRRNREQNFEDYSSFEDVATGPSEIIYRQQRKTLLIKALRRIPMRDYALIELFYWEGMSSGEIHEILDVPASTLRDRKVRALGRLKVVLEAMLDGNEGDRKTLDKLKTWTEHEKESQQALRRLRRDRPRAPASQRSPQHGCDRARKDDDDDPGDESAVGPRPPSPP